MNRARDRRRGARWRGALGALALAALAAGLLVAPGAARAATIEVTTAEDEFDQLSPACSLREAVLDAHLPDPFFCESSADGSATTTIALPFPVSLTRAGSGEDDNEVGDLDVGEIEGAPIADPDVRILGTGSSPSTIEQTTQDGVIDLHSGSLELEHVVISGASGFLANGINTASGTELTVANSAVNGNIGESTAGGGLRILGDAVLTNSTVSGNTVQGDGGGVFVAASGKATLTNVTVSGNTAQGPGNLGGGIGVAFDGTVVLTNSTVSANRATGGEGGGVGLLDSSNDTATLVLRGTILAANTGPQGADCARSASSAGPPVTTSQGHNLLGDLGNCELAPQTGDQLNVSNPGLGPLASNGGPTQTRALLAGSPAIDAGGSECPATDQRGVARPQGPACDIGAFELQPPEPPPPLNGDELPDGDELPTEVALRIKGRRIRLNRRRVAKVRLACRGPEGRCKGRLKLKTRKQVRLRGKRRRVGLARTRFGVRAGQTKRVKLRLSKRQARLVRKRRRARRVRAIARVRPAGAASAARKPRVTKRMRVKPKRRGNRRRGGRNRRGAR